MSRMNVVLIAWFVAAVATALLGAVVTPPMVPIAPAPVVQIGYPRTGGRVLKALRMIADTTLVSQSRLAALTGISATRISRIERGLDTLWRAEADVLYCALGPMLRARFGDDGFVWLWTVHQRNARTP